MIQFEKLTILLSTARKENNRGQQTNTERCLRMLRICNSTKRILVRIPVRIIFCIKNYLTSYRLHYLFETTRILQISLIEEQVLVCVFRILKMKLIYRFVSWLNKSLFFLLGVNFFYIHFFHMHTCHTSHVFWLTKRVPFHF